MAEKKTIVAQYEEIINSTAPLTEEQKDFLVKRMEQAQKKSNSNAKAKTEKNAANLERAEKLYAWLKTNGGQYQVKELLNKEPFADVEYPSTPMVTNLLGMLIDMGKVKREVVKGTPKFSAI